MKSSYRIIPTSITRSLVAILFLISLPLLSAKERQSASMPTGTSNPYRHVDTFEAYIGSKLPGQLIVGKSEVRMPFGTRKGETPDMKHGPLFWRVDVVMETSPHRDLIVLSCIMRVSDGTVRYLLRPARIGTNLIKRPEIQFGAHVVGIEIAPKELDAIIAGTLELPRAMLERIKKLSGWTTTPDAVKKVSENCDELYFRHREPMIEKLGK